jgi:serine/threonine protein kinase
MDFKNRYRFDPQKDLIGRGGFARVFKATDVLLDRVVAIKFYTNTGDNSYTLIKEIGRAIKLEHPNLCRYYDATVLESVSVLGEKETIEVGVMEYLDAGDIAAYLKKHPGYRDRMLKISFIVISNPIISLSRKQTKDQLPRSVISGSAKHLCLLPRDHPT